MLTFQNLWQSEIGFPSSPRCGIDDSIPGGDVGVERLGSGGLLVQALPLPLSTPSLRTPEAAATSLRDRDVDVRGGVGGGGGGLGRQKATGCAATLSSSLGHVPPLPHAHFCTGDVGVVVVSTEGNDNYKTLQAYINERRATREHKVLD